MDKKKKIPENYSNSVEKRMTENAKIDKRITDPINPIRYKIGDASLPTYECLYINGQEIGASYDLTRYSPIGWIGPTEKPPQTTPAPVEEYGKRKGKAQITGYAAKEYEWSSPWVEMSLDKKAEEKRAIKPKLTIKEFLKEIDEE